MPVITIEGPRISDLERKRQLMRQLTGAASRAFDLEEEKIIIILHEIAPECVATGGELKCDSHRAGEASTGQVPGA